MSRRVRGGDEACTDPVLFLDFDGVLHPETVPCFDEHLRYISHEDALCFIPILVDLLRHYPDLKIVVSSDWRGVFDDRNLQKLLGPLGERFIGVVESVSRSRADEILAEAARRGVEQWLAIDDHPSVAVAREKGNERFIVCDPETGMSSTAVQEELKRKLTAMHGTARN